MNIEILNYTKGNLYSHIQNSPFSLSEKEVALLVEKARFDPRLMEIVCEHLRDYWWYLNPSELNFYIKKNKSPYVLKGILSTLIEHCEIEAKIKMPFVNWYKIASHGIKETSPQLLYIGIFNVGSRFIQREVEEALPSFFKHNLIVKDLPFNKGRSGKIKTLRDYKKTMSAVDYYKIRLILKLKIYKRKNHLSNEEMIQDSGINRVFLSQILNNKFSHISIEYLEQHLNRLK